MEDIINNQNNSNKVLSMLEILDKMEKAAELFSKSSIIPDFYKNNKHNVLIALSMAYRFDMDPTTIMYNTYMHKGKLAMSSPLVIALANNSGLFATNIKFRVENEGTKYLKVSAYAKLKKGNLPIESTVSLQMAESDGWTKNNKYKTMPTHMLRYRAATFLIRTHTPEVLNGLHTIDEIEDVEASKNNNQSKAQDLNSKLSNLTSNKIENELDGINDKTEEITISEEHHAEIRNGEKNNEDVHENVPAISAIEFLHSLIVTHNIPQSLLDKWCDKANVEFIDELDENKIQSCIKYIKEKYES